MPKKKSKGRPDDSGYDEPEFDDEHADEDLGDAESVESMEPPDDEAAAEAFGEDASQIEAAASEVDAEVLAAKMEIESLLGAQVESAAVSARSLDVDNGEMIQGVGIGAPEFDFDQIGADGPGSSVLNIYTAERLSMEECRRSLYDGYSVRAVADDAFPLNVYTSGIIDVQPHRHRARPSPCGISVGHFRITAGTQGALARGRGRPRNRRVLMLSNNHVLANSNGGQFGDNILQPGRADGGVNPRDRVGILERFVPVNFGGGANFVDCATAWCWSDRVRKELLYRSGGAWRTFRVSSVPMACRRGMIVGKSGRTTQLTSGRVTGCSETLRVRFGPRVALFRDQIAVQGLRGAFSAGGDSGSLIWTWTRQRNPVGLLFAGGGGITFANKIGRVLSALDINLTT